MLHLSFSCNSMSHDYASNLPAISIFNLFIDDASQLVTVVTFNVVEGLQDKSFPVITLYHQVPLPASTTVYFPKIQYRLSLIEAA